MVRADDTLVQASIANHQLLILNRLAAMQHPTEPTNQLQKISFNEIMTAIDQGYSTKEIFERAQMTNDPRLPNLNQLGGYKVNPVVTEYLSPMNSNAIAAKTAPTPESLEDLKIRLENEAKMKEFEHPTLKDTHATQEKKEMVELYEQMERIEARAKAKVLRDNP